MALLRMKPAPCAPATMLFVHCFSLSTPAIQPYSAHPPPCFASCRLTTSLLRTVVCRRHASDTHGILGRGVLRRGIASTSVMCAEGRSENAADLHKPVLLNQVLDAFADKKLRVFVDGTLGLGGHSQAICDAHQGTLHTLLGIDQDPVALGLAGRRLEQHREKIKLVRGNFGNIEKLVTEQGIEKGSVDGILLDIGISSMQVDEADRGFSFMREGPLDMRMDPDSAVTAADIVNNWSEESLAKLIWEFGEDPKSRSIAKIIVKAREESPIETTLQLSNLLGGNNPRFYDFKRKKAVIHPATLTFQALRIAVNQELNVLQSALPQAMDLLAPGGRLAVISFHSLEDRIVKWVFKQADSNEGKTHKNKYAKTQEVVPPGTLRVTTNKPIIATEEEIKMNPRSRSAKLRVIEKT